MPGTREIGECSYPRIINPTLQLICLRIVNPRCFSLYSRNKFGRAQTRHAHTIATTILDNASAKPVDSRNSKSVAREMYSSNRGKKAVMRRPAAGGFMFFAIGVGLSSPLEAQVSQWDQVMAGAKKEGKVVVSIPPGAELRKSLKEGFEKRFGIELELVLAEEQQAPKRLPTNSARVSASPMSTPAARRPSASDLQGCWSQSKTSSFLGKLPTPNTGGAVTCTWTMPSATAIRF